MSTRCIVTGASGFVGRHLVQRLLHEGCSVVALSRQEVDVHEARRNITWLKVDLTDRESLRNVPFQRSDLVFHIAAHVHVMRPKADDEHEFRMVNVDATSELARHAVSANVRRFVFLSSIKVNGESRDVPFTAEDEPAPQDDYARSKWQAEEALRALAQDTGLDTVTVRPPLVYGPGVGANFKRLLGLAYTGWPLPLGGIDNRRSLISVWNLVDCLWHAAITPQVRDRTWLVSDGDDLSTERLITTMARAMRRPTHLWHVPLPLLRVGGTLLRRRGEIDRLVNSLAVDSAETRRITGWQPPLSAEEGLERTAHWYLEQRRAHQ